MTPRGYWVMMTPECRGHRHLTREDAERCRTQRYQSARFYPITPRGAWYELPILALIYALLIAIALCRA